MIQDTITVTDPKILLHQLKDATRHSHTRLEANEMSATLMSPGVTAQHYVKYLAYMQPIVQWTEEHVYPDLAHIVPGIDARLKSTAIEQDLAVLSGVLSIPPVPVYMPAIPVGDVPFALGMMYVMEGATLGGQVIQRHLRSVPQLAQLDAFAYFSGYGEETGRRWKEFLAALTGYAIENNCMPAIIAGSIYAFETIEDHFSAVI